MKQLTTTWASNWLCAKYEVVLKCRQNTNLGQNVKLSINKRIHAKSLWGQYETWGIFRHGPYPISLQRLTYIKWVKTGAVCFMAKSKNATSQRHFRSADKQLGFLLQFNQAFIIRPWVVYIWTYYTRKHLGTPCRNV